MFEGVHSSVSKKKAPLKSISFLLKLIITMLDHFGRYLM